MFNKHHNQEFRCCGNPKPSTTTRPTPRPTTPPVKKPKGPWGA